MLNKIKVSFEKIIFNSGYAALPFYLIVLLALMTYSYFNLKEFLHYLFDIHNSDARKSMLVLIELIDMGMIAGFSVMMIKGSYHSFVSKTHGYAGENVSSGLLKTKMTSSLVNIVGVSLLQRAVLINETNWSTLFKLGFVYILFLIGSSVLESIDYSHTKGDNLYGHRDEHEET